MTELVENIIMDRCWLRSDPTQPFSLVLLNLQGSPGCLLLLHVSLFSRLWYLWCLLSFQTSFSFQSASADEV